MAVINTGWPRPPDSPRTRRTHDRVAEHHRGRVEQARTARQRLWYLIGWIWAELRRIPGKAHEDAVTEVTTTLTQLAEELHERNTPA